MTPNELLTLLLTAENLKKELRHSWLSDGRQESVAEHCWRLSLMVILVAPNLKISLDVYKALKMGIIHDFSETLVGDLPAFADNRMAHRDLEIDAMKKFAAAHQGQPAIQELYGLWLEYEERTSLESRFIKALDALEVRVQHNEADINTWTDLECARSLYTADEHCTIDPYLVAFNEQVKEVSRKKIIAAGKDIAAIENEANRLRAQV